MNIELITGAELQELEGESGNFTAKVHQRARFIDLDKCTSCGECAKACPISLPDEFNESLMDRKAAFKRYAQAIPGAYAITKMGTAPCKATCPAHVSIQGYIALINAGKYEEALKLFKQEHPFPGVCGRVCHHPCEGECTRGGTDQALAIQYLHRFLADHDFELKDRYVPQVEEARDEKVAIVGAGPAGLTTAYFLAQRGYKVTIYEKLPVVGGMMAVGIPEYRLPREVIAAEVKTVTDMGVEIKTGVSFGTDVTLDSLKADGFQAVFLATGLHGGRALNIPGEDADGIIQGVDFLRDTALGKDVELGKRVVVIGGGNVAIDVALVAKRLGAESVRQVCLESREEMPAWDYEVQEALESEIDIVNCFGPKEFKVENGRVTGLEFMACTCVFDEQGRFNPQYDSEDCTAMGADTIIVAIGQSADLSYTDGQAISVTPRGGLEADPATLQTPLDWVFSGGDAFYGPKSVVDAVASGKKAAESIHRFINGLDMLEGREEDWDFYKPEVIDEPLKERVEMTCLLPEARSGNFDEVHCGYNEQEALEEAQRCLKCGVCSECYQCVEACLAGAVQHDEKDKDLEIQVGSVILAPGSEPFDPTPFREFYQYGINPNVMTSLEFERILSASGPTMGHLARPSDHKEPKKIAWLQCVGSRDNNRCGNTYCSSVCCMYACKDAMIAKEHSEEDLDCAIFYMDMRTYGKDYEQYLNRARDKEGVRFIKARVHTIEDLKDSRDLEIRYADENGDVQQEVFDMVVLSVGLQVQKDVGELAERLGVEVDKHNFAVTTPFAPVATTREGVFACGVFQGPKDIPTSVTEASAAACAAGTALAESRDTLTKSVEMPAEKDISQEEPRIGVFVCKCGINIAGIVDVPAVQEYAATLPHVVYAGDNLFTCSQDAQDSMKDLIEEHNINRVVVASCTPKTHEPIFMDTLQKAGLNKYLFEMANIRNQNSWCHSNSPEQATAKAKDLVRMSVARAATLDPLEEKKLSVNRRCLVVGGGVAGMTAALALGDQGFEVVLLEKEAQLGGMALKLTKTIEGVTIADSLEPLVEKVLDHEKVQVLTDSLVVGFSGFKGNFTTEVLVGPGMYERKIDHGAVILATGAKEYQPKEFLYGEDDRVMTQVELARLLADSPDAAMDMGVVAMIQCVGSRNEENPNCSRICCQSAVKNALHIKKSNPDAEVYVFYRDIRTYGTMEEYFQEARRLGVMFFRFHQDEPPLVEASEEGVLITFRDLVLGKRLQLAADNLILSAGMVPEETEELSTIMKAARNADGYFMEAHVKLRPVDMTTEGIFVCGTAHSPKLLSESVAQALAAASRATTFLSQDSLTLSAVKAVVDQDKCASCLICVRSCPFGVPRIDETGKSIIDPALCQGCGVCASECPAKAIRLNWYEDEQILSKVEALLEGVL